MSSDAVTSTTHSGTRIASDTVSENQQSTKTLHRLIIRKFDNTKEYSSFKYKYSLVLNIRDTDFGYRLGIDK